MSTYELDINGAGAEAGAQRIVKSFDDIKAAANRMEGGVSAAAKKASAAFNDITRSARPVSDAAIKSLRDLSTVFKSFRGPTDAAVRNTLAFLQGLKSIGALNVGRTAGLSSLLAALGSFRGPNASAGRNTLSLLNALRGASAFSSSRGLAGVLASLGAFKGPSAAGARNTATLLTSLQNFTAPRGLAAAARALDAIASAAARANGAMRSLAMAKVGNTNFTVQAASARQASTNVIGLSRSHGILATSILRTTTAMHALGGILAARTIIDASNNIIKIRAQLEAATGSAEQARVQFDFLRAQSEKLGLEFVTTARSYGFFLGSIKGTGVTFKEAQGIFAGFSTAARALQLSVSDVDGIFRALGQIMSKGKLQAEELRGQLGDRLPGAFVRFAAALDMTKPGELDAALKAGAISGDKLKTAILEVSRTLEVEFSGSAEKMSKTVDSAFNRLKNAFTFSAADAGENGLNAAIISITDALTKFIKSEGLNDFLKIVAGGFQILGNNIELVAKLLGFAALVAVTKWVASLTLWAKAMALVNTVTKAFLGLRIAVSLMGTIGAVGTLTTAFTILGNVIKAHPIFFIAAALGAVYLALNKTTDATEQARAAMTAFGGATTTADNLISQYVAQVYNSTNALQTHTAALRADTAEKIRNAMVGLQSGTNLGVRGVGGGGPKIFGQELFTYGTSLKPGGRVAVGESILDKEAAALVRSLVTRDGKPVGVNNTGDAAALAARIRRAGEYVQRPGAKYATEVGKVLAPAKSTLEWAMRGDYKGGQYEGLGARLGQTYGDYNKENASAALISGDPLEKTKKQAKGGKTEAEQWAEELTRNLRSAEKALTDFQVEAEATAGVVDQILGGSLDSVGAAAVVAAQQQVKSFEDTFDSVDKARLGVVALAQQLQAAGSIDAGTPVSDYDAAKEAVEGYYTAVQLLTDSRKKDLEVANQILNLREENRIEKQAQVMMEAGRTMADVNKYREIEAALLGVSADKQEELFKQLNAEIDARNSLAVSMENINRLRDLENQRELNNQLRPLLESNAKQEDIDYYTRMIQLQQKMRDEGAKDYQIADRMAIENAIENETRAQKKLNDELEKGRQYGQDMADAIVGAFKSAVENGGDFLRSFKDLFKNMRQIIMDFVIYNPLKQYLSQILTGTAPGSTGGSQTGTMTTSVSGPLGGLASAGMSILGAASSLMGSTGGASTSWARGRNEDGTIAVGGRRVQVDSYGRPVDSFGELVVTGMSTQQGVRQSLAVPAPRTQAVDYLKGIKDLLNIGIKGGSIGQIGRNMRAPGYTGGIGGQANAIIGAAGQAFAAYQIGNALGKGVGKALGMGSRGQSTLGGMAGGAMAGFSLGGPIGAAIGAVVGGVLGFLGGKKEKWKSPSAWGHVMVGSNGTAGAGKSWAMGKGADINAGTSMARAGASFFNGFARQYMATLRQGYIGTFGQKQWTEGGPTQSYWSSKGPDQKGNPQGREGTDWIRGTESQVQSFALIYQVRKGMITGLTRTIQEVFQKTKALDMESLNADLATGTAYDDFVKGSFDLNDSQRSIQALNKSFNELSRASRELGLDESRLLRARQRLLGQMKEDFDYGVQQAILEITDPGQAAYNQLVQEYRDAVATAMTVGGDLSAVEEYYGLRRVELAKKFATAATSELNKSSRDLLNQLTATSSSPLNASTVFANSRTAYMDLTTQIRGGNYDNLDNLSSYTQNYLDAARSMYGSSTSYFDIFDQVTGFLREMSVVTAPGTGPGGTVEEPPPLPKLEDLVAEINAQSLEMIEEMGLVGAAVIEGSTAVVDAINNLAIALGYVPPSAPAPAPVTPTPPATGPVPGAGSPGSDTYNPVGGGGGRGRDGGMGYDINLV